MRSSTLTYSEALAEVQHYIDNYLEDDVKTHISEGSADCWAFPCPDELGSWSGETNAIYLLNEENHEEIFACAYWE